MNTVRINGLQFEQMLRNGYANLCAYEQTINDLNVFPVADGDTGTNMRLTLAHGINCAGSQMSLNLYLRALSQGMLLGARGNSGVILSQFFKGIYLCLSRYGYAGVGAMRNALIRGYRNAYASMVKPVEGTILTVAREGIEHIRPMINRSTSMEMLLSMYIAEMRRSLARTPDLLPVLREAGVVDSGAMGFILIVEGMLKYLYGEYVTADNVADTPPVANEPIPTSAAFNEHSIFEKGYCLEFVLQLMHVVGYDQRFHLNQFIEDLTAWGNSLAVVQDSTLVKVHIHTKKPAKVIALAQEFGEFVSFKLENMQLQHNEQLNKQAAKTPKKPLSVVAVANGNGMKDLFTQLGCDHVIEGGSTMNTSSQEFLDAFSGLHAETIVVLPNHKNNLFAAQQAVSLYDKPNVLVLPSTGFCQCYFALAMDVPDSTDTEYRIRQMRSGLDKVITLSQTTASRDFSYHEISCRTGDEIALIDGELVSVAGDSLSAIIRALEHRLDMESKETCIVFRGKDVPQEQQWDLEDRLRDAFPDLSVTFLDGGQDLYRWIIGIL